MNGVYCNCQFYFSLLVFTIKRRNVGPTIQDFFITCRYLISLDCSYNRLSTVLGFQPGCWLQLADLSHNTITSLPDLAGFWALTTLRLDHNHIQSLGELGTFTDICVWLRNCGMGWGGGVGKTV